MVCFFFVVIVDLLSIWYIIPWPAMQIAMNEWMEGFNHFQLWSSSALTILRYLMGLTGDYVWLETNPIHYWLIKFVVFALWRGSYFHSNWISLLWLNFRRCGEPKTFQWRMKYFDPFSLCAISHVSTSCGRDSNIAIGRVAHFAWFE